ncbi:MAG: protein kinase domain-containing protein [Bacteroidales bacterium]
MRKVQSMTPQQWERVKRLFHEALGCPAHARADWLSAQCAAHPEVRAEVERLIAAHLAAGSFIETPVTDLHQEPRARRRGRSGSWMGQYRLDSLLGVGGMGEVYQAADIELGRTVAIKVVGHDEAAAHERLRREARHASHLNHPNICTIHHVGDHDGCPFIVMELVEGRPLSDSVVGSGLPLATAVAYARQVLDALAHAHGHGIIHRDLKSANVMVRPDGQVKLLDFGLARQLAPQGTTPAAVAASTIDRTTLGGTLPYMAPEMLRGQTADARTDLWAFGVLLYEMLTGRLPFVRETNDALTAAILNEPPAPLPASVPSAVSALVLRCLEKEPARRPADAASVKEELDRLVGHDAVRHRAFRSRAALWLAFALLAAIGIGGWQWNRDASAGPYRIRTLAVLPLENLSGDASQDYFADGVTEAMISDLGRTRGLRVISRTTAARYRGTHQSLGLAAKDLHVDAVVQGTVGRDRDRVRVTARLFGVGDQQLWAHTYEGPASEILVLQRDVVQGVLNTIGATTTIEEDRNPPLVRSLDARVYESYLKGRYYWNKRTRESLAVALANFRAATAADPTYAPAHVGIANCFNQLGTVMVGQASPVGTRPQAVAAAIAALQIDDSLGEAHAALAYTRHYDWQWPGAEREFRRALELSPNEPLIHAWYANYLMSLARFDEAIAHVQQARELDPLSLVVVTNVGWVLDWSGRSEDAIAVYREALALDTDYIQAHSRLAGAYASVSRFDLALAEQEIVVRLSGRTAPSKIGLGIAYADLGRRREAEMVLSEIVAASRTQYVPPWALAQLYLKVGNVGRCFECLQRAYEERSNGVAYLKVEPAFKAIWWDARYRELLRRVGLID